MRGPDGSSSSASELGTRIPFSYRVVEVLDSLGDPAVRTTSVRVFRPLRICQRLSMLARALRTCRLSIPFPIPPPHTLCVGGG